MRYQSSMFAQALQLLDKDLFRSAVDEFDAEKWSKGFTCWGQLVCMLYCQLAQAKSLIEIVCGLKSCVGKLNHLGMSKSPPKSTLSYANRNRPWEPYRALFLSLLEKCRFAAKGQKRKFRFKNKLYHFDASLVEVCADMFDWAKYRKTKGAVKLHLILDHDGYLPEFAWITDGKTHEVRIARLMRFAPGTIICFDRGYTDYDLFSRWNAGGVYFVTKLKSNALFEVLDERVPPMNSGVVSDQLIKLEGNGMILRKVTYWDEESEDFVSLICNKLDLGATTIVKIQTDRWQIEIFFRNLKQHFRIKTFVGTNANAVHIQIWTALIAMLLVKYLLFKSRLDWSLSNFIALFRLNLFTYRHLWDWIDNPYGTPPVESDMWQPMLTGLAVGQHTG